MALINLKIFGRQINDTLSFKLVVGGVCIILLLVLLGINSFYDWAVQSLVTYIATIFLILSVTNIFINESIGTRDLTMSIIGITLLVGVCAQTYNTLNETIISVIKAFVWATIFSIVIETGKKHIKTMGKSVMNVVETKTYDHDARQRMREREWAEEDNIVTVRDLPGKRPVRRQPYTAEQYYARKNRNQ
jgi:hypothetical protein